MQTVENAPKTLDIRACLKILSQSNRMAVVYLLVEVTHTSGGTPGPLLKLFGFNQFSVIGVRGSGPVISNGAEPHRDESGSSLAERE